MGQSGFRYGLLGATVLAVGVAGASLGPRMGSLAAQPPLAKAPDVPLARPCHIGSPLMILIHHEQFGPGTKVLHAKVIENGSTYYWGVKRLQFHGKKLITVVFDTGKNLETPPGMKTAAADVQPPKIRPVGAAPPPASGSILSLTVITDQTAPSDPIMLMTVPAEVNPCN